MVKEENQRKKLLFQSSILNLLPIIFGVGISYLVKGTIDFKIMAPCVASGYLLFAAFFWIKDKCSDIEKS